MKDTQFKRIFVVVSVLVLTNALAWSFVLLKLPQKGAELYFLNVGQGDSELVRSDGADFLIDAGSDSRIIDNLEKIIPFYKKRIDVVFISHGQTDHAGGVFYILQNFEIGLVVYNGDKTPLWGNLEKLLSDKGVPYVILAAGDKVLYKDNAFKIIWPREINPKSETNDNSMVMRFDGVDFSSLFTADISSKTETKILNDDISADVLKVSHHGSKYSSSQAFIDAVGPQAAIIGVGKNSYGHPTKEALSRIMESGATILRTDLNGLIKIAFDDGKMEIFGAR